MSTLGERFRAAREARGLSLSEVSEQIRIRSIYLGAIEDQNWSVIGAPVYIRGFLRTYARFLGLDPEETVALFNSEEPSSATPTIASQAPIYESGEPEEQSRSLAPMLWVAGVIAVALIAFVVYNEVTMQGRASTPIAASSASPSALLSSSVALASTGTVASPSPGTSVSAGASVSPGASLSLGGSPTPEPSVSPGAGGPQSLQIVVSAPSWLRVTVDGGVSMEGTFPAGTSKLFHGKTATMRIGNAGGVVVYVDGKNAGALGASGAVVERTFSL